MKDTELLGIFFRLFSRALMLLLVLPLVNSVKGIVASKLGDDTADREGRITLNPVAHLDMLGSLCILLTGFGWSKPLPINYSRMRNVRQGVILISLAGPMTHFVSALVCKMICFFITHFMSFGSDGVTPGFCLSLVFYYLGWINVCLGTIHILPLPPMDGFNLLQQFAGAKFNSWYYSNYRKINQISYYILMGLFFIGPLTRYVINPLGWLISLIDNLLSLMLIWMPLVFK